MGRILFISNHAGFSKFNAPYMKWFKEKGWVVDNISPGIEIDEYIDKQYDVAMTRNPLTIKNIIAYKKIKKIISKNNYLIVHCHTPVGGVLGRLCSIKARKNGMSVIYTAHGFHFFRGSSKLAWLLYYNIEKMLAKHSDCIITINQEDFLLALANFHIANIHRINGVGVNLLKFKPVDRETKSALRHTFGFRDTDFILIYVAQFIERKNHVFLINQVLQLRNKIDKLRILFLGSGPLMEKCETLVENLLLREHVKFMGYRTDLDGLYQLSDVVVSVSSQEGLPMNIPEGMACGLPVVCSKIRGHVDTVKPLVNGFLFKLGDGEEMSDYVYKLYIDKHIRKVISKQNIIDVEQFSVVNSVNAMAEIYQQYM